MTDESTDQPTAPAYSQAQGAPQAPVAARIRVLTGESTSVAFVLRAGTCQIGSAPGNDIVLDDPLVSRKHVELSLVPEGVVVVDLQSRNGTFYLEQRIERATLTLGSRIRVGESLIAVDPDVDSLELDYDSDEYHGVLGQSAAMHKLFGLCKRLENSLVMVLVEGPSGSGKERIARAIHDASKVREGQLVTLNCGAIAQDLVTSELFGHKKGAFTGAVESRKGAFESADGGTLFLDEIGELPLEVQPLLLRVLETGEVRPVGSDDVRRVRVRVIAATNRNLEEEVRAGAFREDLFYRLAVVRVRLPPLSERPEDIDVLARAFAAEAGTELSENLMAQLRARAWPGNARELRNAVHAYSALGVLPEASRTQADMLDAALRQFIDVHEPYQRLKDQLYERFVRVYLELLLGETGGNQAAAARIAQLDRTYLGRLAARSGLGKRR